MLSILIPTYNYNARALVLDLMRLAVREGVDYEIIVGDDNSQIETAWMTEAGEWDGVRIIRSPDNLGRARMRNRLAHAAFGEWLLFLDSDAFVGHDFSFRPYMQAIRKAQVVCGSLRTPSHNPNPRGTLRYKYERAADCHRRAAKRSAHPYQSISTFNILVRHSVFNKVGGFDEDCTAYGYEDVLFGANLEKHGFRITHIDNPLVHMGMDDNAEFLSKTETAINTLITMNEKIKGYSKLANVASLLQRHNWDGAVRTLFRHTQGLLRRNLLSRHPSLLLFQTYKLGYYLSVYNSP